MIPWIRIAMIAGAVLALFGAVWSIYDAGGDSRERNIRADYALAEKAAIAQRDAEDRARRQLTEVKDREYQTDRVTLINRIGNLLSTPSPGIRMCVKAVPDTNQAGIPPTTGQPDAAPAGHGPDMRAGRDIERELVQYAGRSESDRQQLIALQAWLTAQLAVPNPP